MKFQKEKIRSIVNRFAAISEAKTRLHEKLEECFPVGTEVYVTYGGHRTLSVVTLPEYGDSPIAWDGGVFVRNRKTNKIRKVCVCGIEGFEDAF